MFQTLKQKHDKKQRAKEVNRCRQIARNKGWSNAGCLSPIYIFDNPARQNAKWNAQEDTDLFTQRAEGATISQLSWIHFRKFNAIEIRLHRLGIS